MGSHALTALDEALEGIDRLGIDSAPIIYLIEENERYSKLSVRSSGG